MKKCFHFRLILSILFALSACPALAAQKDGGFSSPALSQAGGGFSGPGPALSTVADALKMQDNAYASLRGKIERHVGGDHYIFRDATGSITVDIDQNKWAGQNISPQDTVIIHVEVDKDWNSTELEVKQIIKE